MADSSGSNMHQRRHYDAPGAGYAPQQYYPTYMTYNGYPAQGVPYQQQIPPQQWQYYNQSYYQQRPQPSYPPSSQYQYSHHGNYHQRSMPPMQSPYPASTRNSLEPTRQQAHVVSPPHYQEVIPYQEVAAAIGPSPSPPLPTEFSGHKAPYYPPLPWLSNPNLPFPPRQPRSRRRPRPQSASQPVELPRRHEEEEEKEKEEVEVEQKQTIEVQRQDVGVVDHQASSAQGEASPMHTEVSAASQLLSDKETTSSAATPLTNQTQAVSAPHSSHHAQKSSVVVPVIPNILSAPKVGDEVVKPASPADVAPTDTVVDEPEIQGTPAIPSEPVKAAPKSWAQLLRTQGASSTAVNSNLQTTTSQALDSAQKRSEMLGNAIASFAIQKPNSDYKLTFLEPRGLINSGNMCYMNSVLQVLIFCVPFYNFLSHVGRNAVHSFKSDTPLLDAMILFMREFAVIDAADSLEKLRFRLKPNELEQFGEPLLPEYVYEEIRRMPRFATMQRGHQQDAEEFLGFLFEELQGECARAIRSAGIQVTSALDPAVPVAKADDDGWLEVGPKQRSSTTRSSGSIDVDTPINRIFGGQLRSELRIPGNKNSVTLEPYQSLQLDIGAPEVRNITDALRGLTKPETLHGDFQSSRGAGATATKQVFVESLPSVLILHLKRFQYDNTGGTQKIWKKIGYPLELEIPKEAFPHNKRGAFSTRGLPKYRLISVIYHHGKSATAGHYTTDILRQDERDWLRVDDTYIRRVRNQDVQGSSEEDPKILAAALEQHHGDEAGASANIEESMIIDADAMASEKGWSQAKTGGKKWSGVVNGTAKLSGRATPVGPQSLKDNKVAYILFYERIET